jgi:asparagine synthetase B (glutamine-hydrolysing)
VEHLPGEDPVEYRMREMFHMHLTRFLQILLDRKDRLSMAHGLEVRVPFCDHRLVEYVFNEPWTMKTFDQTNVRALLDGHLSSGRLVVTVRPLEGGVPR